MNQCYDVFNYIYDRYALSWQDIYFNGRKIGRAKNIKIDGCFGFIGYMELDLIPERFVLMDKIVSIKFSEISESRDSINVLRGSEIYVWGDSLCQL